MKTNLIRILTLVLLLALLPACASDVTGGKGEAESDPGDPALPSGAEQSDILEDTGAAGTDFPVKSSGEGEPASDSGEGEKSDGVDIYQGIAFTYEVSGDGQSCAVTGMLEPEEKAVRLWIPEQLDGYPVRSIAKEAFKGVNSIFTVKVYPALEEIGESAFEGCYCLTRFEGKAKKVGSFAFRDCKYLSYTDLQPDEIENEAFSLCTSLESFDFSSLDSLGEQAFMGSGLETLAIGFSNPFTPGQAWEDGKLVCESTVSALPVRAFYGCPLRYVLVGGNIKTVGEQCFSLAEAGTELSPTVVIFQEGVEKVSELTYSTEESPCPYPPETCVFLPSSLKEYGGAFRQQITVFYPGTQSEYEQKFGKIENGLERFHFGISLPVYESYLWAATVHPA